MLATFFLLIIFLVSCQSDSNEEITEPTEQSMTPTSLSIALEKIRDEDQYTVNNTYDVDSTFDHGFTHYNNITYFNDPFFLSLGKDDLDQILWRLVKEDNKTYYVYQRDETFVKSETFDILGDINRYDSDVFQLADEATFLNVENELDVYRRTVTATYLNENFPTLIYSIDSPLLNTHEENEEPDQSNIVIDIYINDEETIEKIHVDVKDYLNERFLPNRVNDTFTKADMWMIYSYKTDVKDLHQSLDFETDDHSAHITDLTTQIIMNEQMQTHLQYDYDSDLFILTITNYTMLEFTYSGVDALFSLINQETKDLINLYQSSINLQAGTYEFRVSQFSEFGIVSFNFNVIS
jgi:hypothetical protein